MGNSDTVRKRLSVIVHTPVFDDLMICTFWLDPQQPLRDYVMRAHTTKAWTDTSASFYAADANAAGSTGAYQLDDVTLTHRPALSSAKTDCADPNHPTAGGESAGNILQNPDFESGTSSWSLTGQLVSQVTNNVLQFHRIPGSPAPLISQVTATTAAQDQRWAAIFEPEFTQAGLCHHNLRVGSLVRRRRNHAGAGHDCSGRQRSSVPVAPVRHRELVEDNAGDPWHGVLRTGFV
jgi:hypothetical protein